ncbi:hypothetical protein BDW74DRAFT_145571 [Aspergillus multicolor]|uniref:uncharacterized protein n=1 Tax=Aspergillus multicolor TaxID=41759 RepID=UPI003CCE0738
MLYCRDKFKEEVTMWLSMAESLARADMVGPWAGRLLKLSDKIKPAWCALVSPEPHKNPALMRFCMGLTRGRNGLGHVRFRGDGNYL